MAVSNSTDRFNGVLSTLAIKAPCVAVAVANLTLSGEQTVNGVAVVAGDRVLVIAQTDATENGIYDASSSAWARSADWDGNRDVVSGTFVTVATATVGRNPYYQVTTANPITIGTTAVNFTLADGPNVSYALIQKEDDAGLTTDDINDSIEPGNLTRYGANTVPGTTNVTTAVTNWINVGLQGVALEHPGDVWLCSTWTQISVATDLTIFSHNKGVIKGTNAKDFLQPAGGEIKITGIYFDLWDRVLENQSTDTGTTPDLQISWCRFTNITRYGVFIERPIDRYDISHTSWEDISTACIYIGDSVFANQDDWQRGMVSWNSAKNINNTGAGNVNFCQLFGKHLDVSHNYIENVTSNSGEVRGIAAEARYLKVNSNTVTGISTTSGAVVAAINIKGEDRGSSADVQGFMNSCNNNILLGSAEGFGINAVTQDISLTNNLIENFIVGINTSGGGDNMTISGGHIIGANTSAGTHGINANHAGDEFKVFGVNIHTVDHAIRISSATSQSNWSIDDVTMTNCGGPAIEALMTGVTLSGLSVTNCKVDGATKFIEVGGVDGLTITGNKWKNLTGNAYQAIDMNGDLCKNVEITARYLLTTTDATSTDFASINLPDNSACTFIYKVMGMESDGSNRNKYHHEGFFFVDGGSATQQGSTLTIVADEESDATWGVASLRVSGDEVLARVIGAAATTINWRADISITTVN